MLDAIASPNLQIIFDPVNLLDYDNFVRREEIFAETIELLGPEIAMIHLKDFTVENGALRSVGCGLGEMDYRTVLSFVKEKKPYVHATLENTRPENALRCVRQFWETPLRKGDRRYYDNCLYMFAFLALSGNYRIY